MYDTMRITTTQHTPTLIPHRVARIQIYCHAMSRMMHSKTTMTLHLVDTTLYNLLVQAWMPSSHVCSNVVSPTSPHCLNQAPPRAQQLNLPDFLVVPHLGQTSSIIVGIGFAIRGVLMPGRTNFRTQINGETTHHRVMCVAKQKMRTCKCC